MTLGEAEDYTCKTATNVKQATELIEAGFQYVTTIEGIQLFAHAFSIISKNQCSSRFARAIVSYYSL
jgi:hypothetical protein